MVSVADTEVGTGPSPGMTDPGEVIVMAGTEAPAPPEETGLGRATQSETVMVVVTVKKRVSKDARNGSLVDDLPSRARTLLHFLKRAASSEVRISRVPATECQLCLRRQIEEDRLTCDGAKIDVTFLTD